MQGSRRLCASHLRCAVIEAYLVANLSTQSALHLMGYPLGHCDGSHSAGLGDADFAIFTNTYTKKKQGGGGGHEKPMVPPVSKLKTPHYQGQGSRMTAYLPDGGTVEVVWSSRCQSHR